MPPLNAAPGEVAFGEAYLAWSDKGLALATIGQDYYDLDLLAYGGAFPLERGLSLELDVDAGAGPQRFTLYFIPPKGTTRRLSADGAEAVRRRGSRACRHDSCPAVPGAQALYFGADQPRIVAEALLPWSALGLDGPPASARSRSNLGELLGQRALDVALGPPAIGPGRCRSMDGAALGAAEGGGMRPSGQETPRIVGGWMRGVGDSQPC